ncbi:MAG: helix-turn-helix transcriptional regulator [Gemmatimonadota bacterium]
MNPEPLRTYLRTNRKKSCLSQEEVAFLLGGFTGDTVGKHEKGDRLPALKTVLAYAHIFGTDVPDLYRGLSHEARKTVVKQAKALRRSLKRKPQDERIRRKLEHLEKLLGEAAHD